MDFILPFTVKPLENQLLHRDRILLIGSCFSENIGHRLAENKWDILSNPTGNLFNPISIFKTLDGKLNAENYLQKGDQFTSWDLHGDFTFGSEEELRNELLAINERVISSTQHCDWIMVTLGTAFVYERVATGEIVANCHKMPQTQFRKRLLSESEICEAFKEIYQRIAEVNPNAKWLFTVSPVKHLRDGLTENHISKGVLLKAIHELQNKLPQVYYFPAYELVTDVLRDYRFYQKDFAHPNELAVEYIWERFLEAAISEDGKRFILRWKHIKQALQHRPLHPQSKEHQMFIKRTITDLHAFSSEVDISRELLHFQKQLIAPIS